MGIGEIIKSAPFGWSVGGVGSIALGSAGWFLHEEVTNISWDSKLLKEGYSFNPPSSLKLGVKITNEEQFQSVDKLQSGGCFENFFPGVERITDLVEIKDEEKEDNTDDSQINRSKKTLAIGCAIQRMSYKDHLTQIVHNSGTEEWRILPKQMVYKSEITLKNDEFGIALWTLWTGKLKLVEGDNKLSEWKDNLCYRLLLLKNENGRWEVKGKYHIPIWQTMEINSQNIVSKKIVTKVNGKEKIWFDTSVTHLKKESEGHNNDEWTDHELISFWEPSDNRSEKYEVFEESFVVAGPQMLYLFTRKHEIPKNVIKMDTTIQTLRKWYKPFQKVKGNWKELSEFCNYMARAGGRDVSLKDANRAKNFCYKKSV